MGFGRTGNSCRKHPGERWMAHYCPGCVNDPLTQLREAQEERDRWRGKADCRELDGFLGPSGEPECQGGDEVPSEPMCLTHRAQAAERDAKEKGRALLAIKTSVSKGEMRRIAIQAAPAEKEAPDQSNTSN